MLQKISKLYSKTLENNYTLGSNGIHLNKKSFVLTAEKSINM